MIAFVALLGVGGYLVIERQLTLGQLVAAEIVVGAIAVGIGKLGRLADKSFDLVAATDKLGALLDLPLRQDGNDPLPTTTSGLILSTQAVSIDSHTGRMPPFALHLEAGQKIQLVGDPGIGKSQLLQTLAGHRKARAGRITWDGRTAPSMDALADTVFLASEDALIGGTIIENLRLGDALLSEEQAWSVLEEVGLSELVASLGGLSFRLFRAGTALSSSHRRRLILARALVVSPRLLLVDGILDFIGENNSYVIDKFLGADAPWTAIVVTNDAQVRAAVARVANANTGGTV